MGDSFKKYDEWKHDEKLEDERQTVTSLRDDITKLQRDISKLYTEELFMARIRVSELEQKVRRLEDENFSLLKRLADKQDDFSCNTDDDDWYTSHGQGD